MSAPLDPADLILPDEAQPGADVEADAEVREAVVSREQHLLRLDKVLVSMAQEFSRSWLQQLIERGHVQVDGQVQTTASRKLKVGQPLRLALVPTAESQAFRAEPMALPIVFEDAHLLVIDKPVGLVVHPAAGHWSGTLLNGLLPTMPAPPPCPGPASCTAWTRTPPA